MEPLRPRLQRLAQDGLLAGASAVRAAVQEELCDVVGTDLEACAGLELPRLLQDVLWQEAMSPQGVQVLVQVWLVWGGHCLQLQREQQLQLERSGHLR